MNKDICIHCGKPISYKYYRDWNDNKVCLEHYEYINFCCCCFGFVDRDGRQVEHDRYVCSNCLRQEVSPDNMQSHIDFVYKLLYDGTKMGEQASSRMCMFYHTYIILFLRAF